MQDQSARRLASIEVGAGWEPLWAPVLALAAQLGVGIARVSALLGEMRFTLTHSVPTPPLLVQVMERAVEASKTTCPQCGEPAKFRYAPTSGRVFHEPLCSLHWKEAREFEERLAIGVADAVDAEVVEITSRPSFRGLAGPV